MNFKVAAQQRNSFPHSREPERVSARKRLRHIESDTVVFNGQSNQPIGRTYRNVYVSRSRMLADIVKAFLHKAVHDNFGTLRQTAHTRQMLFDTHGMQPPKTVQQLPQRRA